MITDDAAAAGRDSMRRTFNDTTIGDTMVAEGYGVVVRASRGELE
jgi:hypothetical protein